MNYTDTYHRDLQSVFDIISNIDKLRNSKILITGAGGLIGSAVVDFISELNSEKNFGIDLYAGMRSLDKFNARFETVKEHKLNYFFYDALLPFETDIIFDYIIHAASPANPAAYSYIPVEVICANVYGINALLSYAVKTKNTKILFISSSEVYGIAENITSYSENDYGRVDILNSRACYPSSKRVAETLCASYAHEHDVRSVIVRPGHIYGPTATEQDDRASTVFFRHACEGSNIIMKSAGTQLRSYCYVVDCVSAIIYAMLNGSNASAYNIANNKSNITIRQLAEKISEISGVELCFEEPTDKEKSGYNPMSNSCLNAEKLMNIGWKPIFDADVGIKHTYEIMRGKQ